MRIVALDLSSTQSGVAIADVNGIGEYKKVTTLAIKPQEANGKMLGYTTKAPKMLEGRDGRKFKAFLREGESYVTSAEARRRVAEFKKLSRVMLLKSSGKQLGIVLNTVKPDILIMEQNSSFNGVLTTKLLAEVAGGIYFWAGVTDTPLRVINVNTVRSMLQRLVPDPDLMLNGVRVVDTKFRVKRQLVEYLTHRGVRYNVEGCSLDETDALAQLVYFVEQEIIRGKVQGDIIEL